VNAQVHALFPNIVSAIATLFVQHLLGCVGDSQHRQFVIPKHRSEIGDACRVL
jgi:hypothetical protein